MPMTEQGFQKYTYAQLLEQQITRAKDLFGQDIDTSEQSVLGKYIRLQVSDFAQQEEALENVYQSRYIDTAVGISLDRLTPFACITRNGAVAAILAVHFTNAGQSDTMIPMGTKLVNSDGVLYHLTSSVTIKTGETEQACAECDMQGSIGNALKALSFYRTQIPNITISYPNINPIVVNGKERETDVELRKRWKNALRGSGSGTADAIAGAVSRIDGVQEIVLYENDTDETMEIGVGATLQPHSFIVIVNGTKSRPSEIAKAIFEKKPLGIQASAGKGTWDVVTEKVTDFAGVTHTIQFVYASPIQVKVYVTISAENEPNFQVDTAQTVFENALRAFLESYKIGQTVHANTLYMPLVQTGVVSCIDEIELNAYVAPPVPMERVSKIVLGVDEYPVLHSVEIQYVEALQNGE